MTLANNIVAEPLLREVERHPLTLRAAAPAIVTNAPGAPPLEQLIAGVPAILGEWSRQLFGDELPVFARTLRADFPPLAHVGFRRAVTVPELLVWLAREQAVLRQLFGALAIASAEQFSGFMSLYTDWATLQSRVAWQSSDEVAMAERLRPFVLPSRSTRLVEWLGQLRRNRAQLVSVLNEVDLAREEGNLILAGAGLVRSIFGGAHVTHPLDHGRSALQALARQLRWLVAGGATDGDLHSLIGAARLPAARALNHGAPLNGGWLPLRQAGRLTLVTPEPTTSTTHSLADFYTPFRWDGEKVRFRAGAPDYGLSSDLLAAQLREATLTATSLDELRRVPVLVPDGEQRRSQLLRLVDDAADWPFFSLYRLELDGTTTTPASWRGDHGPGLFQHLVVTRGEVEISQPDGGSAILGPNISALIPAAMRGGYRLAASSAATVLMFSLPGPRGTLVHG